MTIKHITSKRNWEVRVQAVYDGRIWAIATPAVCVEDIGDAIDKVCLMAHHEGVARDLLIIVVTFN